MNGAMLIGPALSAILLVAGWLVAGSRDEHKQPRRALVGLGQWMALAGLLLGLVSLPPALGAGRYAVALSLLLVVGITLVRGAGRNALGWTSTGEIVASAVLLSWRTWRRVLWSLAALLAGVGMSIWLAGGSWPLAGFLGGLITLAPARWWMRAGYARERARTGIERALAGLLSGGTEWDGHAAALRGAPIRVKFDAENDPCRVEMPVPPGWDEDQQKFAERAQKRLRNWGSIWRVEPDHSTRNIVVTPGEKLPRILAYDGAPMKGLTLNLGLARLSEAAGNVAEPDDPDYLGRPGDLRPFVLDLEDTPAGEIVGAIGSGKSVLVRLMIAQWCQVHPAVLMDPKRVEFGPFVGRHNVAKVAKDYEDIAQTFEALEREMDRRYAMLEGLGKQKISELEEQLPDILVVCDEYFELVARDPGTDEESKRINELKARCANSARRLVALGRAAGLHAILLAQRADAEVVKGNLQNNLRFRALMRPGGSGATERNMIGMNTAEITGNPRGRSVMQTNTFPETEVQVPYVDISDLDWYLPRWEEGGVRPELSALLGAQTAGTASTPPEECANPVEEFVPTPPYDPEDAPPSSTNPTDSTYGYTPPVDSPIPPPVGSTSLDPTPDGGVPPSTPPIDPMKYL